MSILKLLEYTSLAINNKKLVAFEEAYLMTNMSDLPYLIVESMFYRHKDAYPGGTVVKLLVKDQPTKFDRKVWHYNSPNAE